MKALWQSFVSGMMSHVVFFRIHAAAEARKRSCSLEEAGREIRRESMKSVLEEVHADKIAFAHHQGDNAETVLMNLCRGSQVKGNAGDSARGR